MNNISIYIEKIRRLSENTKRLIICLLICTITIAIIMVVRDNNVNDIEYTIKRAVMQIASGELRGIEENFAGGALYTLHNFGGNSNAKVEDVKIFVNNNNSKYANVDCGIELKLHDNTYDVSWIKMELVNKNGWKIYNVRYTQPILKIDRTLINKNTNIFNQIFYMYIKAFNTGDISEIYRYVAGEARSGVAKNVRNMKKDNIGTISKLESNLLYCNSNLSIVDFKYIIEEREVENIVYFYKTKEGWKIIDIRPSFVSEEGDKRE